jgi:hypothetical protein
LDLPSETKVFKGSGTLIADTQYIYEGSALTSESGITGYDSSVGAARGNVTTVKQCINTASCTLSSNIGTVAASYSYDIAGSVISAKDADGNTTAYAYADPQNT